MSADEDQHLAGADDPLGVAVGLLEVPQRRRHPAARAVGGAQAGADRDGVRMVGAECAFLIGESLMREADPGVALEGLLGNSRSQDRALGHPNPVAAR